MSRKRRRVANSIGLSGDNSSKICYLLDMEVVMSEKGKSEKDRDEIEAFGQLSLSERT